MSPMRRVLWLERSFPYPPTGGHTLRSYHLLREVAKRHSISLVCGTDGDEDIGPLAEVCDQVRMVPVGWSESGSRVTRALDALGGPPGRPISYEPANIDGYRQAVAELSATRPFDVAIAELGFAPVVVAPGIGASVLDNDDVLDDLYRQLWRLEPWGIGKLASFRRWRALRKFERSWLPQPDALTVCSRRDRALLERRGFPLPALRVIPNGVDLEGERFSSDRRDPDMLVMAGDMSWLPNVDGARFLVRKVMPRIWRVKPAARLWLVGKDPSPRVSSLAGERVVVTGRVADVRPYRWRAAAEVVPLFAGGGTRLKILQAMATGAPVVSTAVGAGGLELRDGTDLLIANRAKEMASAILELISQPATAAALARSARQRVEADFGWDAIGSRLSDLIDALAKTRAAKRAPVYSDSAP